MSVTHLFVTSFLVDDYLADVGFYGAGTVLVSSALGRVAAGLAFQLSLRRPDGPEVVGLVPARSVRFARSLGCYDRVVADDALEALDPSRSTAYVDVDGGLGLRRRLHRHFATSLRLSLGIPSREAPTQADGDLPGAPPTLFFAPAQIRKRREEWGAAMFEQRLGDAWRRFAERVADRSRPWTRMADRGAPRSATAGSAFLPPAD